jgi:predicted RNA-binding protein with PUA-like domain
LEDFLDKKPLVYFSQTMTLNYFLVKTDPDCFSIEDFAQEKVTKWDGVHNYQALKNIRSMQIGDLVLVYYSQIKNPAIVGLAKVVSEPQKDPNDARDISWFTKLELLQTLEPKNWVTLQDIKNTGKFTNLALLKQSRLSVMPVPVEFMEWVKSKTGLDF